MDRLKFNKDWPLPNEFMMELGRISATWSSLESTMNVAISKLAGYSGVLDYRSFIMLAHTNSKQRIEILETLFEQVSKEFSNLKNYESIIKIIKSAQKGRNKFIHYTMSFNPEKNRMELTSLSARGVMKVTVNPVTVNELKEVSAKNHEAMCLLHSIITQNKLLPMWERNA